MYQNYSIPYQNQNMTYPNYYTIKNNNSNDRLVGGFLGPFILGGITGGVVAPYFWGGNKNNNYYYPYPNYYQPYYPYYPYYR